MRNMRREQSKADRTTFVLGKGSDDVTHREVDGAQRERRSPHI